MKKIIMYMSIISLTFFASTDVSAAQTLHEIISSAAKATLDQARLTNTGVELTSTQSLTYFSDYNSPQSTEGKTIVSTMSNMRAQAELYYSNNNSYGIKTQSCTAGIFADSNNGLKSLVTSLRQKSKEVSCISTGITYAVSARLKAGEYWCVDGAGYSKGITKILKKGTTKCSSGGKISPKPTTKISVATVTIFPTVNGFDVKNVVTGDGQRQFNMTRVLKSGIVYLLASKEIDTELSQKNKGLYLGRYIEFPTNSYLGKYLSSGLDVEKIMNEISNPSVSSVSYLRTNADTSSVYQITFPYSVFGGQGYFVSSKAVIGVQVTIKNGIITSIISNSVITSENETKVGYSVKLKSVPNTLNALLQGRTISCVDYLDEDEYCSTELREASMEDSKDKGTSAAIKSYLSNMRAQAELYYNNMNSYGVNARTCSEGIFGSTDSGGLSSLVASAKTLSPKYLYCAAAPQAWVVSAELTTGGYYCVDSTGNAKNTTVKAEYADMSCK